MSFLPKHDAISRNQNKNVEMMEQKAKNGTTCKINCPFLLLFARARVTRLRLVDINKISTRTTRLAVFSLAGELRAKVDLFSPPAG